MERRRPACAGDRGGCVRVWDALTGRRVDALPIPKHPDNYDACEISSDGTRVVTTNVVGKKYRVAIRNVGTGKTTAFADFVSESRPFVRMSPDWSFCLVATTGLGSSVFETASGKTVLELPKVHDGSWSRDNRLVTWGETARVWDVPSGKVIVELPEYTSFEGNAFSPDGRLIVAIAGDNTLRILDATTGRLVGQIPCERKEGRLAFAEWHPSGRWLLTSGNNGPDLGRHAAARVPSARDLGDDAEHRRGPVEPGRHSGIRSGRTRGHPHLRRPRWK